MALGAMEAVGPRNLRAFLGQPAPDEEAASSDEVDAMVDLMLSIDPNHPARLRFSNLLRSWDNDKGVKWASTSQRNTSERRRLIHSLLKNDDVLAQRIDSLLPFYSLDEPLVIAKEHHDWYTPMRGVHDYYWSNYLKYLREQRNWSEASLLNLVNSTQAIIECLANPASNEAYASRGLVMGYVQSGKTANFMGVAARAADAGYRLIIVLAGTWNILRNQTQRRFDKELLGKELLENDDNYVLRPPPDWDEFLEHGAHPDALGHFSWQRLTRPDLDFRRLRSTIDALEYERRNKAAPVYDPSNLHALPAKLAVIKKHSGILSNLIKDLKLLRTKLSDIPTLIIDDESDQAGLNTINPKKISSGGNKRPPTNEQIVQLLKLFPRGQYVGYTATPYANALVDPDDLEDLYPKDFIVSLDRPSGYMGVSDFFDPDSSYDDLQKDDYSQPEIALIRRVESPQAADDEELKSALRSYVLSGAIKLFRHACEPQKYKAEHVKHHTMLVHTSQSKGEHASIASRLKNLWDQCAFNSPAGLVKLEDLWKSDYAKVCAAYCDELIPKAFVHLHQYLSEAIKRIERGPQFYFILNSDNALAPDFGAAPVWKVFIGGNKLSRGYTVEGLTVSYYRRVTGTGDTLMQMGRWFGFRPGYQDLVRVYLGVKEGRHADTDLVALFKEVCRMEERFRQELKRYVRRSGAPRITPKDIPPLIAISGSLPPTAKNKMFNADIQSKNFGGQRSMQTLMPVQHDVMEDNVETLKMLLGNAKALGTVTLGGLSSKGELVKAKSILFRTSTKDLITFLTDFRWLESEYAPAKRPADTALQIEFLQKENHGITDWLIIAPQRQHSFGDALQIEGVGNLTVKERKRIEGRGFQVFGEPGHRVIANYLVCLPPDKPDQATLTQPNPATESLRDRHRGAFVLYPVRTQEKDDISVGFELFFPTNNIPYDLNFTVKRKAERDQIVVRKSAG